MTNSEERFPEDIAYGSYGGPEFSTTVVTSAGGFEKRNQNWQTARVAYNVTQGVKTKAQMDALIAFFRARRGRLLPFRFKDWTDFQGIGENIGIGNGSQTLFQLIKTYHSGDDADARVITRPVEGTVAIYCNAALQHSGYDVDYSTGRVTFTSAPATDVIIRADYEFDVLVRFETDHLTARLEENGIYAWKDISLTEVKGEIA